MDTNNIHVDWKRTLGATTLVSAISILKQRSLSILSHNCFYTEFIGIDCLREVFADVVALPQIQSLIVLKIFPEIRCRSPLINACEESES